MGDKRTYKDRRTYLIQTVQKRRRKLREKAINYKGGHCQVCGYSKCPEALEFHHLHSDGKNFGISDKGYTRSWRNIAEELDKGVLLCANCHREVHSGLQLPREIVVEKSGEFREACPPLFVENGNPEPSPE
jgi:5-methylcytosine-specific restriction endonuclease McrA